MPSRPAPPTILSAASGFARWAFEVAEQERELGVFFDTIVVCSVTGSTRPAWSPDSPRWLTPAAARAA